MEGGEEEGEWRAAVIIGPDTGGERNKEREGGREGMNEGEIKYPGKKMRAGGGVQGRTCSPDSFR